DDRHPARRRAGAQGRHPGQAAGAPRVGRGGGGDTRLRVLRDSGRGLGVPNVRRDHRLPRGLGPARDTRDPGRAAHDLRRVRPLGRLDGRGRRHAHSHPYRRVRLAPLGGAAPGVRSRAAGRVPERLPGREDRPAVLYRDPGNALRAQGGEHRVHPPHHGPHPGLRRERRGELSCPVLYGRGRRRAGLGFLVGRSRGDRDLDPAQDHFRELDLRHRRGRGGGAQRRRAGQPGQDPALHVHGRGGDASRDAYRARRRVCRRAAGHALRVPGDHRHRDRGGAPHRRLRVRYRPDVRGAHLRDGQPGHLLYRREHRLVPGLSRRDAAHRRDRQQLYPQPGGEVEM
ncbi:MAG: Inositol transport system permease protein, partial [uncultured Rubrobacteraceae bacterium]